MDGLILFAHGARDARWREPFERLAAKTRLVRPDVAVRLAFLEFMEPGLDDAVADLAGQGCLRVRIVPMFLGQGGHVRKDLPAALERVRAQHPRMAFDLREAVGEDDSVLARIASLAVEGL